MTALPRVIRGTIAAAALTSAAGLLPACSSGTPTPTKTVTVSATASAAASQTTPAPSPSPSTPAPTGPGPCPTSHLKLTLGPSQGVAGSVYQVIEFINIGGVTCTLYGYPGVALAGGNPIKQIGKAASENPTPPRQLVVLTPGGVANALLRIENAANIPPSDCVPVPATYLQIYPPNQTAPVHLSYSATACSGHVRILSVNVVVPGPGA